MCGRVLDAEHAYCHEGSVHEQEQLVGERASLSGKFAKTQAHCLLVVQRHLMPRMVALREVHHSIQKSTPTARKPYLHQTNS